MAHRTLDGNETLRLIDRRMSLRRYALETLQENHVDAILEAAMRAPTAGNMMLYSIIEVSDPDKKQRLAETCGHSFIAEAPLVLLFLADMQRWFDIYEAYDVPAFCRKQDLEVVTPDVSDLLMSCCDALIAAHNSVIAAESLGIGSCYIGDILGHGEEHRALFDLPRWALPITMVCYGYHPSDLPRRRSARFDRRFIVFRDRYVHHSREAFAEMLADVEERFSCVLEKRGVSLPELIVQGLTLGKAATEQRRSARMLLDAWLGRVS